MVTNLLAAILLLKLSVQILLLAVVVLEEKEVGVVFLSALVELGLTSFWLLVWVQLVVVPVGR